MTNGLVLAVIVNWNGWRDTVTCLESLGQQAVGPTLEPVVCDNGSTDGSVERIRGWARQALGVLDEVQVDLPSGIRLISLQAGHAREHSSFSRMHIMRLPFNAGYAGAINRAMAWGRDALDPHRYWLLNNDVAFEPGALQSMLDTLSLQADIGLCGSVLLEWEAPHAVQALGGRFNRWLAVGKHLKELPDSPADAGHTLFDIDYPVGASMLVSREFAEQVGPMSEDYFLYYEEVDWAQRGRAAGFRPAVALRSRIRHKEGATTGSVGGNRHKSMLSEYYGVVNRLRFTGRFSPWLLPVVWLSLMAVAVERGIHREWRRAWLVLRLMFVPWRVGRP